MSLIKKGGCMTDKYKIVRMTMPLNSFKKKGFSDSEMEEHFKDMACDNVISSCLF